MKVLFLVIVFGLFECISAYGLFVTQERTHLGQTSKLTSSWNFFKFLSRQKRQTTVSANMTKLSVISRVRFRYAVTSVSVTMQNQHQENAVAEFTVQVPVAAFISNFSMLANGSRYVGKVLPKEAAEKEFERARNNSQNAGIVSSSGKASQRGYEVFTISTNIGPGSNADFQLVYQELLSRELSQYTLTTSIRPNQVVADLRVDIFIDEPQEIESFKITTPTSTQATVSEVSSMTRRITYQPSESEQSGGINGDLKVQYDVKHAEDGGYIIYSGAYFAHFFAPKKSSQLANSVPKNIIFVIDISGSMSGTKITQTRSAMYSIINQLQSTDRFDIIIFDNEVSEWQRKLVTANSEFKSMANSYVEKYVKADGGTNINDALVRAGTSLVQYSGATEGKHTNIVVFLTDGQPTSGTTDPKKIVDNAAAAAARKVNIFTLGFGSGVNSDLLRQVAHTNYGKYTQIYEDTDAGEQLSNFYTTISDVILVDVQMMYPNVILKTSLTQYEFSAIFHGSENVVVGELQDPQCPADNAIVKGNTATNEIELIAVKKCFIEAELPESFLSQLYAYLKVKDVLREVAALRSSETEVKKKQLNALALNLSLTHNFVTPLTSMVVVQNDDYMVNDGDLSGGPLLGIGGVQRDIHVKLSSGSTIACRTTANSLLLLFSIFVILLTRRP